MTHTTQRFDYCHNCSIRLAGPFCANCGQKAQDLDPTLAHFLHELTHELLHFDGKIFRSVWTLLARPGVLTREYFDGRRVRWISPIRLYLVFSILYFAVASLESGIAERFSKGATYLMVLMLPLFAWLVRLAARVRRHYPQHLYFALHVHAAWFAVFALMETLRFALAQWFGSTRVVGRMSTLYAIGYAVLAFRKAYQEPAWKAALKMAVVLTVYGAALILGVIVVATVWVKK